MDCKWDRRFLELAADMAGWSKDPSTQCGAVLVRPDRTIAATGYNGFPRGVEDSEHRLKDPEVRRRMMLHAEINAILCCHDPRPFDGYTLYTTAPCCSQCMAAAIQSGIRRFVWLVVDQERNERWGVHLSRVMAKECGAEILEVS